MNTLSPPLQVGSTSMTPILTTSLSRTIQRRSWPSSNRTPFSKFSKSKKELITFSSGIGKRGRVQTEKMMIQMFVDLKRRLERMFSILKLVKISIQKIKIHGLQRVTTDTAAAQTGWKNNSRKPITNSNKKKTFLPQTDNFELYKF